MDDYLLEVKNLTKIFNPSRSFFERGETSFKNRQPTVALKDLSFSLKKGRILGIIGPNGAGKTTLLKIISTIIIPDKGTVVINNFSLGIDDEKIKPLIGIASPEERSFYWRLTGRQNLDFYAAMYGLSRESAGSRIAELLDQFKISYADKRFDIYSTGMKKKFSLIRALLHSPRLLLLDEPTKSLDYNCARELRTMIKTIAQQGTTTIIATHDINEAQNLCGLFLIIKKGVNIGYGSLKTLQETSNCASANLSDIYLSHFPGKNTGEKNE